MVLMPDVPLVDNGDLGAGVAAAAAASMAARISRKDSKGMITDAKMLTDGAWCQNDY